MIFPPHLGQDFMRMAQPVWESKQPDHIKLSLMWELLTTLQAVILGHVLAGRIGTHVFAGPFRDMELPKSIMGKPFAPELLGTYEWELHDEIEKVIAHPYKHILNIGCGHGYYATGFARRMPEVTVHAYDIDAAARDQCHEMTEMNGVSERVIIEDVFQGEDFDKFTTDETFVFVDIEGDEQHLLDPEKFPALRNLNIIVELHDGIVPGLSSMLAARFMATHDIKIIPNEPFSFPLKKILGTEYPLQHFDSLLATWERRPGPTPFGIFTKK